MSQHRVSDLVSFGSEANTDVYKIRPINRGHPREKGYPVSLFCLRHGHYDQILDLMGVRMCARCHRVRELATELD